MSALSFLRPSRPLHTNPHHNVVQEASTSRFALAAEAAAASTLDAAHVTENNTSAEGMDDEGALFEDDVEGQRRLAALLALELGLDRAATVRSDVDETRAPGGDKASEEASAPPSSHAFRLFSSQPIREIDLKPMESPWGVVPNPAHTPLSKADLKSLKARAASAAINAEDIFLESHWSDAPPSHLPRLIAASLTTSSNPSSPPRALLATLPRPSFNPRTALFPTPDKVPERGPGGYLFVPQFAAYNFPPPLSKIPTIKEKGQEGDMKKKRSRRPSHKRRKTQPSSSESKVQPNIARFYRPDSSLGGKALGYAYGYQLGCEEDDGTEREGFYRRDRMKIGWATGGELKSRRGIEGYWGRKGDGWGRRKAKM